jgi:hypothetical protein
MALGFVSLGFVILPSPFKTLRLQALGCRIQNSSFIQGPGYRFEIEGSGSRDKVWDSWFRIQGLGARV